MEANDRHEVTKTNTDDDDDLFLDDSDGETWLTSYADLMTLIACFFILIVAFANFEDPAFQIKAQEFSQYFKRSQPKIIYTAVEKNIQKEKPISNKTQSEKLLSSKIEQKKLSRISTIDKKGDYEIIHSASVIFPPGKIRLTNEVKQSLDVLIELIKESEESYYLVVEGHTDDTDINNIKYPSNWELSAARSAIIIKKFVQSGLDPNKLVSIAYGNTRPLYPNRDKSGDAISENQRLNRRAVIKLLKLKDVEKDSVGAEIFFRTKAKNSTSDK